MTIGISLTLFFPLVFGGLLWAGEGVVSFQAVGRDGEVLLEWKTVNEIDIFGFYTIYFNI